MEVSEATAQARLTASKLPPPPGNAADAVRAEAMGVFARAVEPPLYRRRDDPCREHATTLLPEVQALLARAYQLEADQQLWPFTRALEDHLAALCLIAAGKAEQAEGAWHRALASERAATASLRLWVRSDETRLPVYDKDKGVSRYDPRPEALVNARLACPRCRKPGEYHFSPRHAHHRFGCKQCGNDFHVYFAEVRALEVEKLKRGRRYRFRLDELGGVQTRIDLDDAGPDELHAARRDLLAFLYAPQGVLRGVLNLNSSRVLWVTPGGACFVATAVFGEGAPELLPLRRFRDEVLAPTSPGRAFVRWYYRQGPSLARWVRRSDARFRVTRASLKVAARAAGWVVR